MRSSGLRLRVRGVAFVMAVCGSAAVMTVDESRAAVVSFFVSEILAVMVFHALITGAAKREGREERAWRVMALGLGLIIPSNMLLLGSQMANRGALAQAGEMVALAATLVAGLGAFLLPRDEMGRLERVRLSIESLAAGLAAGTSMWWLLREFSPTVEAIPSTLLVNTSLIAVATLLLGRRSINGVDRAIVFLTIGVLCVAAGDLIAAITESAYRLGTPPDVAYFGAQLALVFMAEEVHTVPAAQERLRPIMWRSLTLVSLSPLAVLPLLVVGRAGSDPVFRSAVVAVTTLLVVGQMIAVKEQRDRLRLDHRGMVATVAHELRTPLTAVVAALVMLEEGDPDEDLELELISTARAQAEVLSRVVGDMVSVARDTMDRIAIDPAPVRAQALVEAVLTVAETDVDLLDLDFGEDAVVVVDQARLQQALTNLLRNASRYGDGRIALVGRCDNAVLQLEIHDDGPGVHERYERLVWERFERGAHRLDAHIPGSGIGLSVVRGIARAHGGEAGYRRSERLGGACFWLSIPASRTHQRGVPSPAPVSL